MRKSGLSGKTLADLNAYLDGQLRPDEMEHVGQRVRREAELKTRLEELRRVRTLVRQGFGDTRAEPARARRGRRPYALAAALLIGITLGWLLHTSVPASGVVTDGAYVMLPASLAPTAPHAPGKVLVHVDSADPKRAEAALWRIETLLAESERKHRPMTFELVVNAAGLDLLRADVSPVGARIRKLNERGQLGLVVCRKTLAGWRQEHRVEPRFLPGVVVGPPAIDHIIDRLQHGWTYVRV